MSYLEQYDATIDPREKVALVNRWIRTDWRPFFAELRRDRPILATPAFTLVARYADVTEVLSRERVFSVAPYAPRMDQVVDGPFMLARDGTEVNWREKGLMQAVLRPEDLPHVRRLARRYAEEALDRAAATGRVEVVGALGRYVPVRICGSHFGFPGPDTATMYRWSKATQWDMFKNLPNDPVVHRASVRAGEEMLDHLYREMRRRRAGRPPAGDSDVFGRLLDLRLPAELGFDDHRVLANVAGLLIGGVETTSQAVVQALEQLLRDPDRRREAVAAAAEPDPARFDAYVWEALRFNPINPLLFRRCESDHPVATGRPWATTIPKGTLVFALTASAMFDADAVPEPDTFRTDRPDFARLHFGYGHHACLGRHVASVTIPEVVRRVLRRTGVRPAEGTDGTIDFGGGPFPERFVVQFDPAGRPPSGAAGGRLPGRGRGRGGAAVSGRSTARDGWGNRLEFYVLTHFRAVWELVQRIPPVRRRLNRLLINRAINRIPPRPHPLSTMAPYTSWESLTDRTYAARHLPPVAPPVPAPPPVERTADLFTRDRMRHCEKSTVLFAHFAQWFTDGFLRTDRAEPHHPGRTTSQHEVDLSQLYGLRPSVTRLLRAKSGGELKSQHISGEEFPPYLCADGAIKPEFDGLAVLGFERLTRRQRDSLFAMGGDRANSQAGYAMLNVLFLREHNRVARLLAGEHPEWDDERVFATARNVVTVLLIKIVIEEYINHITPYHFRFRLEPGAIGRDPWYRTNWMAIEFNLLYRWHSLVPDTLRSHGRDVPVEDTLFDNTVLTEHGLGAAFDDASRQPAGRIGLRNTAAALRETEVQSVVQAREVALASYNDYRKYCGYPRVTRFDQITGDPQVHRLLEEHYGTVDRIEYYPGLFAEDLRPGSALPPLIGRMVGIDAFSQVLTNPLLAPRIYGEQTLSAPGLRIIADTHTLADVLARNVPAGRSHLVTMTRTDWRR